MNHGEFMKHAALAGLLGGSSGAAPGGEADIAPVLSSFAWVNQGPAVAAQRTGYVSIVSTDTPAGDNARLLLTPAPAAPYAMTMRITGLQEINYHGFGPCAYDSTDGTIMTFGALGGPVRVAYWSSVAAIVNAAYWVGGSILQPQWMRLRNDGTKLYFDMSVDGYSFVNVYSEAINTHLAHGPDKVGVFMYQSSAPCQVALRSFKLG